MPELPEVEVIVRKLRQYLKGKIPIKIINNKTKILRNSQYLSDTLNRPIYDIYRKGKLICFYIPPYYWLIHLKMTGQLMWQSKKNSLPPYTHLIVIFKNTNYQLCFADKRQFGYFEIVPEKEISKISFLKNLGSDALSITPQILKQKLKNKRLPVKSFLLNQKYIAGLGNIYSDEILWKVGIHPLTSVSALNKAQIEKLSVTIREVLKLAIKLGGTSIKSYIHPDGEKGSYQKFLNVYRRKGLPCKRCGTLIESLKINGRNSYFCPKCQIMIN